ncbi:MAG: L-ribulose-5-phosphate 4-epimerase [Bacteroidales bacterium]|nr:L-ribulose-5-phosphate 4-epimerase [Lentimicrobiaceae bacterium]MDD5694815.1 L-ribulose-5-phosphate 4-epimerase [Bacteroidales bacterium]
MLNELKERVYNANLDLVNHGLVLFTFGNVSGIDREKGWIVIKPSGIDYRQMKERDMVVVDLSGKVVEGRYRPSTDTPTHLQLYKAFPEAGGIAHTHSTYATAWAQAGKNLPILGTTHADHFSQPIPCTPVMTPEQVEGEYETATGLLIIHTFNNLDYRQVPGVLVRSHGPFTWGKDPAEAVYNSVILEELAHIAYLTLEINPESTMNKALITKHYRRKHGKDSYYGQ